MVAVGGGRRSPPRPRVKVSGGGGRLKGGLRWSGGSTHHGRHGGGAGGKDGGGPSSNTKENHVHMESELSSDGDDMEKSSPGDLGEHTVHSAATGEGADFTMAEINETAHCTQAVRSNVSNSSLASLGQQQAISGQQQAILGQQQAIAGQDIAQDSANRSCTAPVRLNASANLCTNSGHLLASFSQNINSSSCPTGVRSNVSASSQASLGQQQANPGHQQASMDKQQATFGQETASSSCTATVWQNAPSNLLTSSGHQLASFGQNLASRTCTADVRQNASPSLPASTCQGPASTCQGPANTSCPQATRPNVSTNNMPNAWKRPSHIKVDWKIPDFQTTNGKVLTLNEDAIKTNLQKLDLAIVGKLIGKRLPFSTLLGELRKKWSHIGTFQLATLEEDCFMCLFDNLEAKDAVLMGGPWSISGCILGLDKWSPQFSPTKLDGLTAPIWIRLPHLPMPYWDNDNLARIASMIGEPLWIDAYTGSWGRNTFARICIRLDLSKQLPKGVWIPGLNGRFFQPVHYEGVSSLCFKCGFLGHKETGCPQHSRGSTKAATPQPPTSHNDLPTGHKEATLPMPKDTSPTATNISNDTTDPPPTISGVDEGQWTLVTRRRSKGPRKPPTKSTTTLTTLAKVPTPDQQDPPQIARTSSAALPMVIFNSKATEHSKAPTRQTTKARVSKAHFDKELSHLGPISSSPRKRKKQPQDEDTFEFLGTDPPLAICNSNNSGGDASPSFSK